MAGGNAGLVELSNGVLRLPTTAVESMAQVAGAGIRTNAGEGSLVAGFGEANTTPLESAPAGPCSPSSAGLGRAGRDTPWIGW